MAGLAGWDWLVIGLYFAGIAAVVWWSSIILSIIAAVYLYFTG